VTYELHHGIRYRFVKPLGGISREKQICWQPHPAAIFAELPLTLAFLTSSGGPDRVLARVFFFFPFPENTAGTALGIKGNWDRNAEYLPRIRTLDKQFRFKLFSLEGLKFLADSLLSSQFRKFTISQVTALQANEQLIQDSNQDDLHFYISPTLSNGTICLAPFMGLGRLAWEPHVVNYLVNQAGYSRYPLLLPC
jgi:hypothetical protein